MYRTILLSFFAATLVAPGALYAMGKGDAKKDDKVQADSTKPRKTKPGTDDADEGKKKLKPRVAPNTPAPSTRPHDDDEAGEQIWDTEFLVRNAIPHKRGPLVVFASF